MSVSQDSIGLRSAMGAGLLPYGRGTCGVLGATRQRCGDAPSLGQEVVTVTPSIVQYQLLAPV
ncbi:hypothetical protein GCM10017562_28800 [Streptomyces roseofulvus]